MAITPRTLVTNPAAAAVAAWTVLGLSLMASDASRPRSYAEPCASQQLGSELQFVAGMQCYADHGAHERALYVGYAGIKRFPLSEALHNQIAIENIQLGRHAAAVEGLASALEVIEPSNATMENNLVWASLWTNADPREQRAIYRRALKKEPKLCEAIHTGMMVEWRLARGTTSFEKAEAITAFASLSERYDSCIRGSERTPYDKALEDLSVSTAKVEIDQMLGISFNLDTQRTVNNTIDEVQEHGWSIRSLCEDAIPGSIVASGACQRLVFDVSSTPRIISSR